MKHVFLLLAMLAALLPPGASARTDAELVGHLKKIYQTWRAAMIRKDAVTWRRFTSNTRQIKLRNRILSERRQFPGAVFETPMAPPGIANLKAMSVQVNGPTAKATYFGKVDFGIGGEPTDNLFVISYVREASGWKYHAGEFVKLDALPDVRKELQAGNKEFLKGQDFRPDGKVEKPKVVLKNPAKYIAKAYVFCPGREVRLLVNNLSSHLFQNTKRAEVVIGGARDGRNEVQFAIKSIEGGDPEDPITVRIYLMSEVPGTKPIKALEYQVTDGSQPKSSGTLDFTVDPETAKTLTGR